MLFIEQAFELIKCYICTLGLLITPRGNQFFINVCSPGYLITITGIKCDLLRVICIDFNVTKLSFNQKDRDA
jgi:hypothetical protein